MEPFRKRVEFGKGKKGEIDLGEARRRLMEGEKRGNKAAIVDKTELGFFLRASGEGKTEDLSVIEKKKRRSRPRH